MPDQDAVEVGQTVLENILAAQETMTPEERVEWWAMLQESYCPHCGETMPVGGACFCRSDD